MKLTGVFIKFTGSYLLINFIGSVLLGMLNIKSNIGATAACLMFATKIACDSFTKKNGVFFSKSELRKAVFGFAIIHMMYSAAVSYLVLTSASIQITSTIILALIIEFGLVHTAGIYFFVRYIGRVSQKTGGKTVPGS